MFALQLALLCGCSSTSRTAECRRIAKVANPTLEEIQELDSDTDQAPPPETYTQLAQRYRSLDKALGETEATLSPDVKASVTAYRALLRSTARECERYRDSMLAAAKSADADPDAGATKQALELLRQARERMQKSQRSYASQVNKLKTLCSVNG